MADGEDDDAKLELLPHIPQNGIDFKPRDSKPLLSVEKDDVVIAHRRSPSGLVESPDFELKTTETMYNVLCNLPYTHTTAAIYFVNYSTVVGFVALPYAFYESGYVAGTLILIWTGILNYVSFLCVSNLMIRAETIVKFALQTGMCAHIKPIKQKHKT